MTIDHGHDHGHTHPTGIKGFIFGLFVPHSHDAADSIDDAMEANRSGIRALKISLLILLVTTILQAAVVLFSGSVALLADTVHNFSDALTAVPLWVAFVLGRRAASRRYTYGLGRAEDLAGLFIVFVVALSAIVAAWQSIDRILNPQPLTNIGWVIAAGIIGFLGNEIVAVYRIRVGRRLLDGVEPELVDRVAHALEHVDGIESVDRIRLRWNGHRLEGDAILSVGDHATRDRLDEISERAHESVRSHLPNLDEFLISTRAPERDFGKK